MLCLRGPSSLTHSVDPSVLISSIHPLELSIPHRMEQTSEDLNIKIKKGSMDFIDIQEHHMLGPWHYATVFSS